MNFRHVIKLIITIFSALNFLIIPISAIADISTSINVRGEIIATCKFVTAGAITFTLDPSVGGTVYGSITQPTFWCTKGTAYTISDDKGLHSSGTQRRLKNTATPATYIPYSFSYTNSGTGNGGSNALSMNISSAILQGDYTNAPEGSDYSDIVTLTLNP